MKRPASARPSFTLTPTHMVNPSRVSTTYFSYINKEKLKHLTNNLSESDAEKILQYLFEGITKEDSTFRLSNEVENALTSMILDKTSGG